MLFSYTNTARLFDHVVACIEYRYDRSSLANGFFYEDDAARDTDVLAQDQHTVSFPSSASRRSDPREQ